MPALNLRLSPEEHEFLRRMAFETRRSINEIIRELVQHEMAKEAVKVLVYAVDSVTVELRRDGTVHVRWDVPGQAPEGNEETFSSLEEAEAEFRDRGDDDIADACRSVREGGPGYVHGEWRYT